MVLFAAVHESGSAMQLRLRTPSAWVRPMRRRDLVKAIAVSAAAWPVVARGEVSTKRSLIAVLSAITKENNSPLNAFVQGLKELGYADGVNVDIVYRFAEERLDRFPVLAVEVVELRPDVILATVTPAVVATRALTKSIPIVCPLLADAINLGLIASEAWSFANE